MVAKRELLPQERRLKRDISLQKGWTPEKLSEWGAENWEWFNKNWRGGEPKPVIGGPISALSENLMRQGLYVPVAQKRPVQWEIVRQGLAYRYLGMRLNETRLGPVNQGNLGNLYAPTLNFFAFALYNDDERVFAHTFDRVMKFAMNEFPLGSDGPGKKHWRPAGLVDPALLKLAAQTRGVVIPHEVATHDCGIYDVALTSAGDTGAFEQALIGMCERHVERMIMTANTGRLEFDTTGFTYLAYEVWLFRRLNPAAKLDHLLVNWLDGPPPKFTISDYTDETLEMIYGRWPELRP